MNRRRRALVIGAIGVVGAVVWFALVRRGDTEQTILASGTVEATEARLGFQATGRIERILFREGDAVTAGTALAHLDRAEMLARRDQAAAQVRAARALLRELEEGSRSEEVAQARAARDAAQDRVEDARRDLERTKRLYDGGAVGQEMYDKAVVAFDLATSQLTQAAEQLKLVETGPRPERVEAQRAQLAQAEAALRAVQATLRYMSIVAPFDAVVTVRHRQPGEIVPPGSPVLTLMNPDDRWIRIYVREDRIGSVRLGAPATITSDTYPDKRYAGEVMFIASEAEFTPKNVQTTEERVKLVYAVKVRVVSDEGFELKPGMPADVLIELMEQ